MTRHFRHRLPKPRRGFKREVVKLQRPLVTNEEPTVLIYNEDKSVTVRYPLTDSLKQAFGDDFKQYWLADVPEKRGELLLLKQVKEQEW